MAGPFWRAPSAEDRAAAGHHQVRHSVGLVLTAHDPGHGLFSFRVSADGAVIDGTGWGWAGPAISLSDYANAPPTSICTHTVLVDASDSAVRAGLRELVDQHLGRYAECGVWCAPGVPDGLAQWVRAGCPAVAGQPAAEPA